MPLQEIRQINAHTFLGIWHITEALTDLQQDFPGVATAGEYAVLKTEKRQKEWLSSRILVNKLQLHFLPEPKELQKDEFGKPYIGQAGLQVSLTHSGPYAAAILSSKQEVGIDIEFISPKVKLLANKFLSETEKTDAAGDTGKICVCWSAKETLYKLYGRKKLLFIENLPLKPFELQASGKVTGSICTENQNRTYVVNYEKLGDYILTYCAGETP